MLNLGMNCFLFVSPVSVKNTGVHVNIKMLYLVEFPIQNLPNTRGDYVLIYSP